MARSQLSEAERRFLLDPPRSLARIATVDADGMPHVVPGGWSYDPATQELVLGGRDVPRTVRAAHVRATGRAAVVIDGLASGPGWSPWAFMVRGRARIDDDSATLRLTLDDVTSWGLTAIMPDGPSSH
ncbi:pyridoxamine 5'-phosphate oxidase family protein [Ornithinimicrobium cryptoxanthini]|uniref:Pyridoxamine 5'-phosphate oxidase family protein n=1 Tax=Ornithinimicrobium cryptoxanthini TaxID=2934161 RepID=A0ABY4YI17_9MICO|nr:pyridoxamine 5'-phosphate oxidase family protein [Ornithinimicrobium cryptoxanthini]USQ76435.1 pyridoxamine 5'-phosphate oxidase family protein [Ornithinimicrobium cryptoxanthini]